MADLRVVEVMVEGVGWTQCSFGDVVAGDTFRMFESTGEPVVDNDGNTEFVSIKDAYQMPDGAWCLETKDEE